MKEEVNQELHEFRRLFQVKYDQPADLHDMMAWCLKEIDHINRQVEEVRTQVSLGHQSVVEEMLSKVTWLHSTYKVNCYNKSSDSYREEEEEDENKEEGEDGDDDEDDDEEEEEEEGGKHFKNRNRSAGRMLLRTAVANGHTDITVMLLNRGVDVNGCNDVGCTALHAAVDYDNVPVAQLLLQRGADVHSESREGIPIQLSRSSEMVRLLLDAGTDIKAKFSHTNPAKIGPSKCIFYKALRACDGAPLVEAIIRDNPDTAKYSTLVVNRIERGKISESHVRVLLQDPQTGTFNFSLSINRDTSEDIVDLICATPWFQSSNKTKAQMKLLLDRAIHCQNLAFVSYLLGIGADIEASPVLFKVVSQGTGSAQLDLVDLLITNGANTVYEEEDILQHACNLCCYPVVALLVTRGIESAAALNLNPFFPEHQTLLDAILSDPSEAEDVTLEKFRNVLRERQRLGIEATLIVECMVIRDLPLEESDWNYVTVEHTERIMQLHAVLYPVMGLK